MSNYSQLYWLTRLDNFQSFFQTAIGISIGGIIIYLVFLLFASIEYDANEIHLKRKWIPKTFVFTIIFSGLTLLFVPTKNDLIFIYAGGKAIDYVQEDTSLQKIPFQTTKIISNYLDSKLNELETQIEPETK
jgi:hypothetical protein